jgi:hypothetical protein
LGWEVGFAHLPSRERGLTDLARYLSGVYWRPTLRRFGAWAAHGQVGLGFASTAFDRDPVPVGVEGAERPFPDAPQTGGTYLGLAAGLDRHVGAPAIFVEARYDAVSSGGAPFDFFAVVVGLRR